MVRVAHSLLVIASLLVCPINCVGALDGEAHESPVASGCTCCQRSACESDGPSSSDEPASDEDCDCGSCLCQGAVRSDHEADWYLSFADAAGGPLTLIPLADVAFVRSLHLSVNPDDSLSPTTGRAVRILHQSFLI